VLLVLAAPAGAQHIEDRTYLRNKVSFRYVATPNDTARAPAVLDNIGIWRGTETGAFWSNASIPGLKNMVRSLLQEPGRGGDANLQYVAAQILHVQNRPVIIMLLSLVSGATADIWDRRLLMLIAQGLMLVVAAALTAIAYLGLITPWTLLCRWWP